MAVLLYNVSALHGITPHGTLKLRKSDLEDDFRFIPDAFIIIGDDGYIDAFGKMSELPQLSENMERIDCSGRIVLPAFCDSHTHLVYAGSRHGEFVDKINGLSYEQIAARGGGILNSADVLAATSEDELFNQSLSRINEIMLKGTAAVEIKSGYGLSTSSEIKMLRVIARLAEASPLSVRATFLGAHAVGREFKGDTEAYVRMLISQMLPAVAAEGIAEFVDVFCDRGFFSPEQTERILSAAAKFGMRPKIHANELDVSGGVQVGVKAGAVSVDHLERITDVEIELLRNSETIATMLPGASFFLGMPYAPARNAMDAGVTVALASDFNPGSSPSGDMRMVWALGCIKMKLNPVEALAACTVNGAAAMDLPEHFRGIDAGKWANLIITRPLPALESIPYAYTSPWIEHFFIRGRKIF